MVTVGAELPDALSRAPVSRADGVVRPFGELTHGRPLLAVFVRHFGCVGCAEGVLALIPRLDELASLGVRVVLVGSGPAEHIEGFVERFGLADKGVEIVTDPSLGAFAAAGLPRSVWATYGPRAVLDFLRAFSRSVLPRPTSGDLLQQGGALLVDEGRVIWMHRNASLGGNADPSDVVGAVLTLRSRRAPVRV
jgi:hypothetical protein